MTSQIERSPSQTPTPDLRAQTTEQKELRAQRRAVARERDRMVQRWVVANQKKQAQEDPNRALLIESLTPSKRAAIAATRVVCCTANLLACTLGAAILGSCVAASDRWLRHLSGRYIFHCDTKTLYVQPMTLVQSHRFGLSTLIIAPCAAAWGALIGLVEGAQAGFVLGCESMWHDVMRKPEQGLWGAHPSQGALTL